MIRTAAVILEELRDVDAMRDRALHFREEADLLHDRARRLEQTSRNQRARLMLEFLSLAYVVPR